MPKFAIGAAGAWTSCRLFRGIYSSKTGSTLRTVSSSAWTVSHTFDVFSAAAVRASNDVSSAAEDLNVQVVPAVTSAVVPASAAASTCLKHAAREPIACCNETAQTVLLTDVSIVIVLSTICDTSRNAHSSLIEPSTTVCRPGSGTPAKKSCRSRQQIR